MAEDIICASCGPVRPCKHELAGAAGAVEGADPTVIRVHYGDPDSYARAYNAAFDDVAEQYGIRDLPERVFDGANRYDTDDEHVLSLWADGQTWDIRWPKAAPGRATTPEAPASPPLDVERLAEALSRVSWRPGGYARAEMYWPEKAKAVIEQYWLASAAPSEPGEPESARA